MATQDFKRKLAAILHADVKGYSRLMGEDEEATVRHLNRLPGGYGRSHKEASRPGSAWLGRLPAG